MVLIPVGRVHASTQMTTIVSAVLAGIGVLPGFAQVRRPQSHCRRLNMTYRATDSSIMSTRAAG
jgi:hypothetical protein